jgi:hypothetical protein
MIGDVLVGERKQYPDSVLALLSDAMPCGAIARLGGTVGFSPSRPMDPVIIADGIRPAASTLCWLI